VILALFLIALLMLGSAAAAMLLRNLIHSALLLILSWAGVAMFYLWAGAEFVAFAQILVYVGAISMVVLFAVLLTRQNQIVDTLIEPASRARAATSFTVAACVAAVFSAAILTAKFHTPSPEAPTASVKEIGLTLMNEYGGALLIVGLILTVALLGATILAATDRADEKAQPLGTTLPPEETP
jgi:NADH:ubiquinone oxidoreductase subunit 6 (subunit J)